MGEFLSVYSLVDFLAVHGDVLRRIDADAHSLIH
jgi:hypothetical protein